MYYSFHFRKKNIGSETSASSGVEIPHFQAAGRHPRLHFLLLDGRRLVGGYQGGTLVGSTRVVRTLLRGQGW